VEDGVLWASRAEGVTALEIARGSAAAEAGIQRGDVLIAVNGEPIEAPADVIEYQHGSRQGTRLSYTLLRLGAQQALQVALTPAPRGGSMYFVLAAVGFFTLLVGASVRLRRPRDQATLHFFWLCVAFFGWFTFSFAGPFDRLDWFFYWGDAVAVALLPPLLLHFTLVFPERERRGPEESGAVAGRGHVSARVRALRRPGRGHRAWIGGIAGRRDVFARDRPVGSVRAGLSVRVRRGGDRRAGARLQRNHVADGAPAAALDRVGHDARRRTVRLRLRAALGLRHRSAARPQAHRDSSRTPAADLRLRDRALPAARRRSHREARPRLHRVSRRQRGALLRDVEARQASSFRATTTSTRGSSPCWRRS
jgi:hypothetical protein